MSSSRFNRRTRRRTTSEGELPSQGRNHYAPQRWESQMQRVLKRFQNKPLSKTATRKSNPAIGTLSSKTRDDELGNESAVRGGNTFATAFRGDDQRSHDFEPEAIRRVQSSDQLPEDVSLALRKVFTVLRNCEKDASVPVAFLGDETSSSLAKQNHLQVGSHKGNAFSNWSRRQEDQSPAYNNHVSPPHNYHVSPPHNYHVSPPHNYHVSPPHNYHVSPPHNYHVSPSHDLHASTDKHNTDDLVAPSSNPESDVDMQPADVYGSPRTYQEADSEEDDAMEQMSPVSPAQLSASLDNHEDRHHPRASRSAVSSPRQIPPKSPPRHVKISKCLESVLPPTPPHTLTPNSLSMWLVPHIVALTAKHAPLFSPTMMRQVFGRSNPAFTKVQCRRVGKRDAQWATRWFLQWRNFLFEYATPDDSRPVGIVPLVGATVLESPGDAALIPEADSSVATFTINFRVDPMYPASSKGGLAVCFRCDSQQSARSLLSGLSSAGACEFDDLYEVNDKDELGSGRFVSVFQVTRKCDGKQSAVKLVDKEMFWKLVREGKERPDTIVREVAAQAVLTFASKRDGGALSPGKGGGSKVVKLVDVVETSKFVAIEIELMKGGDLFQLLDQTGTLGEQETRALVEEILLALEFIRDQRIAHRDIKLSNLIFDEKAPDKRVIKVADFGMATFEQGDGSLRGRCGTPGYVAPEILHAKTNEPYSSNVDMFSVGVVAYTLLCGYEPFYGQSEKDLICANKRCEYEFHAPEWDNVTPAAKAFVGRLMDSNPATRATPAEALLDPWIVAHPKSFTGAMTRDDHACCKLLEKRHSVGVVQKRQFVSLTSPSSSMGVVTNSTRRRSSKQPGRGDMRRRRVAQDNLCVVS